MHGPDIITRTLTARRKVDRVGNAYQYHSRSDHHSKLCCWAMLFDLMLDCALLRRYVELKKVVFGINHTFRDFENDKKKDLDLVLCTPGSGARSGEDFGGLVGKYDIVLSNEEKALLSDLPPLEKGAVGAVQLALEAKACMTEHVKAAPRLYDELNSSHSIVHGHSSSALAAGMVLINAAPTFVSPGRNLLPFGEHVKPRVNNHRIPEDISKIIGTVRQLPRRAGSHRNGFDAMAVLVVSCHNDGTPVEVVEGDYTPQGGDNDCYDLAIKRLSSEFRARFDKL